MKATGIIRTIYLYLFSLLGLIFIAIGSIRLLDMALRTFVFREADALERYEPPPVPTLGRLERVDEVAARAELSEEDKAALRRSIQEYRRWEERRAQIDPVRARRQRDASSSLAMILVGLPLYLYHWRIIRREAAERRRRREDLAQASAITPQ